MEEEKQGEDKRGRGIRRTEGTRDSKGPGNSTAFPAVTRGSNRQRTLVK